MTVAQKDRKENKALKALDAFGRGTMGFLRGADRALDKVGFARIDPLSMVGGRRQQNQGQISQPNPQKPMEYCPVCGWVYSPHRHRVIET